MIVSPAKVVKPRKKEDYSFRLADAAGANRRKVSFKCTNLNSNAPKAMAHMVIKNLTTHPASRLKRIRRATVTENPANAGKRSHADSGH